MKAKKEVKQAPNRYSPEFKKQALERADKEGIATVARALGLKESRLYSWRQKRRLEGTDDGGTKAPTGRASAAQA